MISYCEILGVADTAGIKEITAAYRAKALQYHPDKGGNAEEFKKITLAYEYLTRTAICGACGGKGQYEMVVCPFAFIVPCRNCNGKGRL